MAKQKVYTIRDSRGHLCVDCAECTRGGNGDKSCAAGHKHKRGGRGACFNGIPLPGISDAVTPQEA